MRCPRCDHNIHGRAFFCPNCGAKLEFPPESPPSNETQTLAWDSTEAQPEDKSGGKGHGLTWLVVAIAILVLLLIAGLGYAAIQAGRKQREVQIEQTAEDLYLRGEAYLQEGQLELAVAAYEQALLYYPDYAAANERLAQVQGQLTVQPTATPLLQRETKQAYWNELMAAYETGSWELVIEQADKLIEIDPEYNRDQVNDMLVEAFYELGLRLVDQDQMAEAVRYFESALVLAPDNTRIALAKELATDYMTGMGYWAADWPKAISYLQGVYNLNAQYKDVEDRLNTALITYGDLLADRAQWCQASEQYTSALAVQSDADTLAKNQEATLKCAEMPTPVPGDESSPATTTTAGTFVGQLDHVESISSGKMYIRGQVLDQNGQGIVGITVKIQAWDWSALAITDGTGQFSFDGLGSDVVYTLTLPDLPSEPVDVEGHWGELSWVVFNEAQ